MAAIQSSRIRAESESTFGSRDRTITICRQPRHALTRSQSAGGTASFSYDNAGNMLTDGAATYTYSDRARMASATIGANTVAYKFNGLDQRVSKSGPTAVVPSGAAYYAYDEAGQLIGEYDASVKPGFETITLGATPVAVLKQTGSASNSTLQVVAYNVWADHLDTPRVVTRSNDQAIVWRWDSAEAFGATAPNQNPIALGSFSYNQRFPGQLVDLETGSFYNWYRDYRAGVGRYVQSDPVGLAGGINTYSYVGGNPVQSFDPHGLMGRGGIPSTPGPRAAASCTCSEIQVSVGAGGLAGFGPTIVPAGFVGLGVGFGFTTSGMFFVQGQGTLAAGAGVFAGGGAQVGATRNATQTRPGFSDSYAIQGDANFGAGPAVGGSVQVSPDGAGVQTGIGRLGGGYGAQASIGVTRTLTYAWQILPSLRCECCP